MAAEAAMLDLGVDSDGVGQHLFLGDAEAGEERDRVALIREDALVRDRVDRDLGPGPHHRDRLGGAPEIAPMYGLRAAADDRASAVALADEAGCRGALETCIRILDPRRAR